MIVLVTIVLHAQVSASPQRQKTLANMMTQAFVFTVLALMCVGFVRGGIVATSQTPPGDDTSATCSQALVSDCNAPRMQGVYECGLCAGQFDKDLQQAGCTPSDISTFCADTNCSQSALDTVCAAARANGTFPCTECLGAHENTVTGNNCSTADQEAYCGFKPNPTPTPKPGPGCCSQCTFTGTNTKCSSGNLNQPGTCPGDDEHASCQGSGFVICMDDCGTAGYHAYCENMGSDCSDCQDYSFASTAGCKTLCDQHC